jgi:hypothetical protein
VEALDLRALVAVEDLVVAPVRQHEPQARFRPLGQALSFRRLREPEVHRQRIVQEEAVLDADVAQLLPALLVFVQDLHRPAQEHVEAPVHQHFEEPVVAGARHHVEAAGTQDLHVDPAQPQAVRELPEVVQCPHRVEARLLARTHEEDAIPAEAAVHGDADGHELPLELGGGAQVHDVRLPVALRSS